MKTRIMLCAASVLVFAACDSNQGKGGNRLNVATFNTGLARGYVLYASERSTLIGQAVSDLGVDILCLQEVWRPADVTAIQQGALAKLPESFFLEPLTEEGIAGASCTEEDRAPLEICARKNCPVPADELANCVLKLCNAEFNAVTPPCQACLVRNVGEELDAMIENCTTMSGSYSYNGSFGIGLLSKRKLEDRDHLVLDSTGNRRAILYATVNTAGFGKVHLFCTHLTSIFTAIDYTGTQGSWKQEQFNQMGWLIDFMDSKVVGDELVLLMGDLNSGPAGEGFAGEAEENFQILANAMDPSPYLSGPSPACTFCEDNTLVQEDKDRGIVVDHILYRNFPGQASAQRILDAPISLQYRGETLSTFLSDHYGLKVTLTP